MIEQQGNPVTFQAHYKKDGEGVTGLTVTVDVWEFPHSGGASEIVSAGNATEAGDGLYYYKLAAGSVDAEAEYTAVFKSAGDVDEAHLAAVWAVGRAGVEHLDASIQTVDTVADAIQAKTDNLPASPAATGAAMTLTAAYDAAKTAAAAGAEMDLVDAPNSTAVAAIQSGLATAVSIAALPQAVWEYTTRTLTSLSALVSSIATAVWAATTRTLTQSAASVTAAVAGTSVSVQQATTWSVSLTGLGSLAGRDNLVLMVKEQLGDADADAILWVDEDAGLIRVNGAGDQTAGKATLVVDDEDAGDITLTVSSDITAGIAVMAGMVYDVKALKDGDPIDEDWAASGVGTWNVTGIVTRAIS